jgi:CubicO group peptidase (beta-lactamase class C family)
VRVSVHPTAFVALCALACAGWLTLRPDEALRVADKYIRAQTIANSFSGAVLIARHGKVVFSGGYGDADIEHGVRNDTRTRFRIGSVTKPLTAILVLKLQEDGALKVSDPICRYFEPCPPQWAPLTIHHLLSHTSGVENLNADEDLLVREAQPATRDEVFARFRDAPLRFPPGEKFEYSNSNYHLLGAIVEKVTGQTFGDALAQRVLAPASMVDTFMGSASAPTERVAVGYRPSDDGTLKPDARADPVWLFAAGGVFSTAEDLLRLGEALKGERVLTEASKTLMWTPVQGDYGYGWSTPEPSPSTLNRRIRMHSGRSQGYTACFVQFVDDDVTGIVLSNNVMADTCTIIKDLAAIELGDAYSIPIARRAIKVDHSLLDHYAGRYHWSENYTLVVSREGDLLVARLDSLPDHYQLYPESPTQFFLKTIDVVAEFQTNRRGQTTQLVIRSPTQEFVAKRIAD